MAIGERIRFIRNLRGMTQKWLGQAVGFPQKTADIRMAQYESGSRTPKEDLVKALANVLEVSPLALNIPDIDSDLGFIHTLFAVEDIYGVRTEKQGDEVHIVFDGSKRTMNESVFKMLSAWADQAEKLKNGEISKDQYDRWRIHSQQRTPLRFGRKFRPRNSAICWLKPSKKILNNPL